MFPSASRRAAFQTASVCRYLPSCAQRSHTLAAAASTNLALAWMSNQFGQFYRDLLGFFALFHEAEVKIRFTDFAPAC